ncbi:MAG TPA: hypothetical protein VF476_18645 [Chitinophagaceae bacterium]
MRKNVFPILAIAFLIASCKGSADKKVPEIAADYCKCFEKLEKEMSDESKKLFTAAGNAADPTKTLEEELLKLDEETQGKVGIELMSLGELEDESSEMGSCIKGVEKKYGKQYTLDEKKFANNIIKELEAKPGCSFTASLMKVGLKVEESKK